MFPDTPAATNDPELQAVFGAGNVAEL